MSLSPTRAVRAASLLLVLGGAGALALGTATSATADSAWFVDSVSPADRAAEIPVPAHPKSYDGKRKHTEATMRTRYGSLAVPITQAYGHHLETGQALSLSRGSYFRFNSTTPTKRTKREVAGLASALSTVTSVTCEGYADYAGPEDNEKRISQDRAEAICKLIRKAAPQVTTRSVGYGGKRPAVVGGDNRVSRAQNRRVVIVVTQAVTPTPTNHAPVANPDTRSTPEDTTLTSTISVLANDSDQDGDPLTAELVNPTTHGTLTFNRNGTFSYQPAPNYNGPDSFTYRANDGQASSDVATVSITVSPVNDPPVANPDSYTTNQNQTLVVPASGVLANDTDVDGDALHAILVVGPADGTVTLNSDGSFVYVPDPGDSGPDAFTYRANDGTANSNPTIVAINVTPVNQAPTNTTSSSYSGREDTLLGLGGLSVADDSSPLTTTISVLHGTLSTGPTGATISNNNTSTVTLSGTASQINASLSSTFYTPTADYNGSDSFTISTSDGSITSSNTVPITLTPVQDAFDDSATASGSVVIDVNGNDSFENPGHQITAINGSPIATNGTVSTAHGFVQLNAIGTLSYTPSSSNGLPDSFTYTVTSGGATETATVRINDTAT